MLVLHFIGELMAALLTRQIPTLRELSLRLTEKAAIPSASRVERHGGLPPAGWRGSNHVLWLVWDCWSNKLNPNGNRITIEHDTFGGITRLVDSVGREFTTTLNSTGLITDITDPL